MWLDHRVMSLKAVHGIANHVDPDQRSSLIWVYTDCPDLSVRKLRIITVFCYCEDPSSKLREFKKLNLEVKQCIKLAFTKNVLPFLIRNLFSTSFLALLGSQFAYLSTFWKKISWGRRLKNVLFHKVFKQSCTRLKVVTISMGELC